MNKVENEEEYEDVISSYYEGRGVSSIISFEIDTQDTDKIANEISSYKHVEDVLLVTGDVDLIVKARFKDFDHKKEFLTQDISDIEGIENHRSMMIVTTYKERGKLIEAEEE